MLEKRIEWDKKERKTCYCGGEANFIRQSKPVVVVAVVATA